MGRSEECFWVLEQWWFYAGAGVQLHPQFLTVRPHFGARQQKLLSP